MSSNQSLSPQPEQLQPILDYLKNQCDWVEEVLLAAELSLSLPVLRERLNQLLEQKLIETNGDGQWRKVAEAIISLASRLEYLEEIIEKGFKSFIYVGSALAEIREMKLYKQLGYNTFEHYCRERWSMVRRHADRLIKASAVVKNIANFQQTETRTNETHGSQNSHLENETHGSQNFSPVNETRGSQNFPLENETHGLQNFPMPLNERQVRPLVRLEPEQQQAVWLKAVEDASGAVPTGKQVEKVAQDLFPTESDSPESEPIFSVTQGNFPLTPGTICWIVAGKEPNLRALNGFWGFVTKVYKGLNYCDFLLYKGIQIKMRLDNLTAWDIDETEAMRAKQIMSRMAAIMEKEPEASVVSLIQNISRRQVTSLTDMEEQYLTIAEEKLGILPKKTNSFSTEFKPEKLSSKELTSHVIRCFDYLTNLNLQSVAESLAHRRPECIEALTTTLANDPETAEVMIRALESKYPHLGQAIVAPKLTQNNE